jgi:hypothetical protein
VIVQAKDSGQATLTLSATEPGEHDLAPAPGLVPRAIWLINNDVLPALFTLTLGNYPIYLPAGAPGRRHPGEPLRAAAGPPDHRLASTPRASARQGDVILVDLKYYQAITKAEGVQTATSMHLYFDADAMAFRTTFRMDGQPKIAAADLAGQRQHHAVAVRPAAGPLIPGPCPGLRALAFLKPTSSGDSR